MTSREHAFRWLKRYWHPVALALLVMAAVAFRLRAYGDPRASISTADTDAFISTSRLPLVSWEFLTSNRPPTIALLYKLLEPSRGYEMTSISEPAVAGPTEKALQPGLDRVALAQTALSVFSWCSLTIACARRLRHPFAGLAAAVLILTFAFSPQLAEWDSVLMSESVSLSLFALLVALTLETAHALADGEKHVDARGRALTAAWVLVLVLWVFSRDSNAYALPVTAAMTAALLAPRALRQRLPARILSILAVVLAVLFVFHGTTLRASDRWVNPFLNNLIYNILPDQERLAFFQDRGMPVSDEVLAFRDSRGNERGFLGLPDFMAWVRSRGYGTYAQFLLAHPRWTISTLVGNLEFLFSENRQPYFHANYPAWFEPLGNMLHMTSGAPILLDGLLTAAFVILAVASRSRRGAPAAWVFVWLLLNELVMLFVSYHGDTLGVIRHVLVAAVPLRLSVWLLPLFLLDLALPRSAPSG